LPLCATAKSDCREYGGGIKGEGLKQLQTKPQAKRAAAKASVIVDDANQPEHPYTGAVVGAAPLIEIPTALRPGDLLYSRKNCGMAYYQVLRDCCGRRARVGAGQAK